MKKSFKEYLESIKNDENKTIVEAFSAALEGIFNSDTKNYLTVPGTLEGNKVSIEVNVDGVDVAKESGQRGYRDSLGAPEEPDFDESYELQDFDGSAVATILDSEGIETESKVELSKEQFEKVMTDKVIKDWKGNRVQLNLKQYVEYILQENIEDWI